jgi:uncharacterized protein (DUF3084 family)
MSDNSNSRVYGIVVSVMLLLAAGLGYFFWQKSKDMIAETKKIEAEKAALVTEKGQIERSLDSLSLSYSDLRAENENLKGSVNATADLVRQKESAIKKIQSESVQELNALRAQIADLQKLKIEMETIVTTIKTENEQLKADNQRLTGENTQLKGEKAELAGQVQGLAKQLEEQIRKTQSATFKASAFRVELERRNDKLTAKARRVREINVSFDLADVPQAYQGAQKLYLVITDDKGNPIKTDNPTKATVYAPTGPVEISAQQVKAVSLETTQRFSFTQALDERLKAGNYVVAIYCDKGLLGASSFKLG